MRKKFYSIVAVLAIASSAQAQRALKLDMGVVNPSYDTNIVTGSSIPAKYILVNNSVSDKVEKGDTVKFFDPSCEFDPAQIGTSNPRFKSYIYVVFPSDLAKGSGININSPLTFSGIKSLIRITTPISTDSMAMAPFTNNKQYAWFVLPYSISKGPGNTNIASLSGGGDTSLLWINKTTTAVAEVTAHYMNVETIPVFPNPATNNISFEYNFVKESNATVAISDVTGRTVLSTVFENNIGNKKFDINISNLAAGSYFIQVTIGNSTMLNKFNIQK